MDTGLEFRSRTIPILQENHLDSDQKGPMNFGAQIWLLKVCDSSVTVVAASDE